MSYDLEVNGFKTSCIVTENELSYVPTKDKSAPKVHLEFADIIGVEQKPSAKSEKYSKVTVHFIDKSNRPKWSNQTVQFKGETIICDSLTENIRGNLEKLKGRPKSLLVIINPTGGEGNGKKVYETIVQPLFQLANIKTEVIYTEKPHHVTEIVTNYDLSSVDGIILGGGDGTFQECINTLLQRTQKKHGVDMNDSDSEVKPIPVPIGILPTGTGNGIAEDCYGCVDHTTAALKIIRGNTEAKNLGAVYSGNKLISYFGLIVSYGLISELMYSADKQRWLGAARYLFVSIYHLLVRPHQEMDLRFTVHRAPSGNKLSKEKEASITIEDSAMDKMKDNIMVFEGRYTNASMFVGDPTNDDFAFDMLNATDDNCLLILTKPTSRCTFLDGLVKLMKKSPNAFQLSHMETYKVTKFKVEATPVGSETLNHRIDIDGETFRIEKPEFEVRMLPDAVMTFSADGKGSK